MDNLLQEENAEVVEFLSYYSGMNYIPKVG